MGWPLLVRVVVGACLQGDALHPHQPDPVERTDATGAPHPMVVTKRIKDRQLQA